MRFALIQEYGGDGRIYIDHGDEPAPGYLFLSEVEASEWLEAKSKLGFQLSDTQEFLLERHRRSPGGLEAWLDRIGSQMEATEDE
ncbi:hypothetical protein [Herbaspirillum sp.]|uniref:hypothetical protein n=1 Tax=Herbaspirillum sp. TaxID=1890675 RepID=UPI000C08FCF9|nr:hypothetical protein [Herbaspirillum sp.]MAF04413.1 hypothetical protein [Herbaspirillum sp.]MBO18300.1 hypothetical protein [Herbaspirillum sp.]|tara:strand:- start:32097 stop:32351 length:255 start_codon:yes stop_codon:yes gene_type:complete